MGSNKNIKIVIAEDSATQAAKLQYILEDYGYTVFYGKNGEEAIKIIQDIKPDLVISDIIMPKMDGYELTKHIKEDPLCTHIPVILVTTLANLSNILKGLECGAANYIIKPYEEEDLIPKINTVLKNENTENIKFVEDKLVVTHENFSYNIDSKSTKLIDFLITTYENVLKKNKIVEQAQFELRVLNDSLEDKVEERTATLLKEVTERKQYQFELEESERKYRLMATNTLDTIWTTDMEFNITFVNEAIFDLFGYRPEEFIGLNSTSFTTFEGMKTIQNVAKELLIGFKKGEIIQIKDEAQQIKKDGTLIDVEITTNVLLNDELKIIGFQGRSIDITERKNAEEDLKLALLKATESDRLKSAFLANINHEIRTPMNSILGFSDLLMNKRLTETDLDKYYKIMNSSGKRLMNIINEIVDISKIEAKELSLEPVTFNLNKLIDQLHQQFSSSVHNKNTVISIVKALKDTDSFINLDETRLFQVFSNLLENALKYTEDGAVEFGYTLNETEIHFYVKDSGVGIKAKDHQLIFERFGKSDNELLKVKEGSGLGLSISKGIVELFGGNIWVESEPNKGAAFHFTTPNCVVIQEDKSIDEKKSTEIEKNSTKTILIAEDEETNFWYIEAVLEGHPFELIHVENGRDAVEKMQNNNSIALILMDFNMPIMNGLDATAEIRKTNTAVPIIALTAYAMMADKEKALAIGCTDYLSKPVTRSLLLETINKYI